MCQLIYTVALALLQKDEIIECFNVCVMCVKYNASIYNDLVPKGAQEKRTEVLENKVDRM